ncbi:MAG: hypothetical protein IID61_05420 [SAR324 cluster bacterium]|nr:hypothetical protein [SAR324 cluster bacterium]
MTESAWHLPSHGPGRLYQQGRDLTIKFEDRDSVTASIAEQLKTFLHIESSVRLLLDSERVNAAQTVITVPFEGDNDTIFDNLATLIFDQIWGYYLSAEPKTTHYGLTHLMFEGNTTSLVRREAEKFLAIVNSRNDIAGRVLRNYRMACDIPAFNRDIYLKQVVRDSLDIHLGVRIFNRGEGVNRITVFVPITAGDAAIDRLYYNLEHIIHQNLVAYDEIHDHYLPVSEELILREVEAVLLRARSKGNTRKKLVNGLKFHTVVMEDPALINHISLADLYYDKINRIDLLEEAAQRSREMFASALIRSTELTTSAVKIDDLKLEERVYIERPAARETVPAQAEEQQEEEAAPVTVHTDGLTEL